MTLSGTQPRSVRLAEIGVLSALYVATSFVPISMFIGAPSFLALNLIIAPIMAILLPPMDAFLASFFGGFLSIYVAPSQAMFGPYTIFLPICGATFGSLAAHNRRIGPILTSLFLSIAAAAYLFINFQFPYFVLPHLVAAFLSIILVSGESNFARGRVCIVVFVATMCEQAMMMILSVHLLQLPWQVFVGILPLMIYERIISTAAGTLVILGLWKMIPTIARKL